MPALSHPDLRLPRAQDHPGPLLLDKSAQVGSSRTTPDLDAPQVVAGQEEAPDWGEEGKPSLGLASPGSRDEATPVQGFQQHFGDSNRKLLFPEGQTAPSHNQQGEGAGDAEPGFCLPFTWQSLCWLTIPVSFSLSDGHL